MMEKEFDIEKIGRQMPYKAPGDEFFANFATNLTVEISRRRKQKTIMFWRSAVAAAVVAFGVVVGVNSFEKQHAKANSLDKFVVGLSDEDLNTLITDSQYVDEFYAYL